MISAENFLDDVKKDIHLAPTANRHGYLSELILARCSNQGARPIVHTAGSFYQYNTKKAAWSVLDELDVEKEVVKLDGEVYSVTDDKAKTLAISASTLNSIMRLSKVQAGHKNFFDDARDGVQFQNGFLCSKSFKLEPSNPDNKQRFSIDCDWNPAAECPLWEAALDAAFWGEDDAIDKKYRLQEFAGAILVGIIGKVLFLTGTGANGKSTVIDVLSSLVPDDVRTAIAPHKFSDGKKAEYWIASLAGARLNVDADISAREMMQSSEFKKSITGDELGARDPAGKPFKIKPKVLHLFSANELPGTLDHSKGYWRRIMVLDFARDFEAEPDTGVSDALKTFRREFEGADFGPALFAAEKAGIMAWAIRGAKRLIANNYQYTEPSSSTQSKAKWKREADQVAVFLEECCSEEISNEPKKWIEAKVLYKKYSDWSKDSGYRPLNGTNFGKRMGFLGYSESTGRRAKHGSKRYRIRYGDKPSY